MMRITNGMMMNTTKTNINNNKVSVDRLNTQMSTQKKITKPSDNPLIAIKSLRLSTTLSQINQYYGNNIKDAQSWMDVTETALTNMKDILTDAYRLAVNGSTGTLTDEDRNTVLTQLKSLSSQLYAEANADYADRTVFSGYKTNSTVTFQDALEASNAKYEINEQLSINNMQTYTYYANKLDTPSAGEVQNPAANKVGTPQEEVLKRLRLAYNKLSNLNSLAYTYAVDTSSSKADGTTNGNVTITADMSGTASSQLFQWRSLRKDGAFTYEADAKGRMTSASLEDMNGYKLSISPDGKFSVDDPSLDLSVRETTINGNTLTTYTYTDESGNMAFMAQETLAANGKKTAYIVDSQGNRVDLTYDANGNLSTIKDIQGNTIGLTDAAGQALPLSYEKDPNGNTIAVSDDPCTITVKNADNKPVMTATSALVDTSVPADPTKGRAYALYTADKNLTTNLKIEKMTEQEFNAHLAKLAADPDTVSEQYKDTIIYLPDSGEMVLGTNIAQKMSSEFATLNVNYDKEGFAKGETRPEMYFNCTNKTDISAVNHITYTNYDADGNWIQQNINYAVSANQDMKINTQIRDVVSADCYRDLAEMTDLVQEAVNAHTTVTNIQSMINSGDYTDKDQLAYLKDCLEKAQKQVAYADDHLQKVFGTQITNFERYLSQVNLEITDIGSRGDQLSLTENRMSNQKTTFTQLKSNNEDEELSDVTIDYTSAFTAFQASLKAAGKIDNMTLLDYL